MTTAIETRERPVIMYPHEVRAVLEGRQSQFRRPISPEPNHLMTVPAGHVLSYNPDRKWAGVSASQDEPTYTSRYVGPCPYGQPGDELYVRETWGTGTRPCPRRGWRDGIEYRADEAEDERDLLPLYEVEVPEGIDLDSYAAGWHSPITMPRFASRILLRITDIRVERVQEISEADARAEGIPARRWGRNYAAGSVAPDNDFVDDFRKLWDSINKRPGCSWVDNPWAWVIDFERVAP